MLDEERGLEEDRLDGLDSGAPADASQGGGLPCRAWADVALMTVEKAITDPDVCACGCVSKLSLTNPTLKALDVEVEA